MQQQQQRKKEREKERTASHRRSSDAGRSAMPEGFPPVLTRTECSCLKDGASWPASPKHQALTASLRQTREVALRVPFPAREGAGRYSTIWLSRPLLSHTAAASATRGVAPQAQAVVAPLCIPDTSAGDSFPLL